MAINWESFNRNINTMLNFAIQKKLLDYRDLQRMGLLKEQEAQRMRVMGEQEAMYGRVGEERLGRDIELAGEKSKLRIKEDVTDFWLDIFKDPEVDYQRAQTRYLKMFGEDPDAARESKVVLNQIIESQTKAHEAAQLGKPLPTEDIRTGITALPTTERMGITREISKGERQRKSLAIQREREKRLKEQFEKKGTKEVKDTVLTNLLQKERVMSRQFKDLLASEEMDVDVIEKARTRLNDVREKTISRLDITMFSQEEINKNQIVANEIKSDESLYKLFMNPSTNELLDGELLRRKLERSGFNIQLIRLLIE